MNKKERVEAAISRRPVDRTPYNFRAEPQTLERLYRCMGIRDYDVLIDRFNPDIIGLNAEFPVERDMGGWFQNYWGERYVYHDSEYGPVRDDMEGALSGAQSLDDIKNFDWPSIDDVDYSGVAKVIDRHPNCAVQYGFADVWQRPGLVRGMANFFMDMAVEPQNCHYMSGLFTEFYEEEYRRAQQAAGGKIRIFNVYSDLGSQNAPLISLDMFREFVAPYVRRMADCVHALNGALFFHSCGMIHPFIDTLIDAGVDILDPLQPCHPMMQPEVLARDFGSKVCFHGGIDVQGVLAQGTPDDVRAAVARYTKAFEGCGYICSPSHFLQVDAPPENIFALFEETMNEQP